MKNRLRQRQKKTTEEDKHTVKSPKSPPAGIPTLSNGSVYSGQRRDRSQRAKTMEIKLDEKEAVNKPMGGSKLIKSRSVEMKLKGGPQTYVDNNGNKKGVVNYGGEVSRIGMSNYSTRHQNGDMRQGRPGMATVDTKESGVSRISRPSGAAHCRERPGVNQPAQTATRGGNPRPARIYNSVQSGQDGRTCGIPRVTEPVEVTTCGGDVSGQRPVNNEPLYSVPDGEYPTDTHQYPVVQMRRPPPDSRMNKQIHVELPSPEVIGAHPSYYSGQCQSGRSTPVTGGQERGVTTQGGTEQWNGNLVNSNMENPGYNYNIGWVRTPHRGGSAEPDYQRQQQKEEKLNNRQSRSLDDLVAAESHKASVDTSGYAFIRGNSGAIYAVPKGDRRPSVDSNSSEPVSLHQSKALHDFAKPPLRPSSAGSNPERSRYRRDKPIEGGGRLLLKRSHTYQGVSGQLEQIPEAVCHLTEITGPGADPDPITATQDQQNKGKASFYISYSWNEGDV